MNDKELFECQAPDGVYDHFTAELKRYMDEGGRIGNISVAALVLTLIVYYLLKRRPVADRQTESILKLLGAAYKDKGYRAAFWTIMRESSEAMPEDEFFAAAPGLERRVTNDDIDELFAFVEYEIIRYREVGERERLLGLLDVCRVRYRSADIFSHLGRLKKEKKDVVPRHVAAAVNFLKQYNPESIKAYLDRYVVGQDDSKRILSAAVYNHYLRLANPDEHLLKSNVLLIGPTGCGKTELIRRLTSLVNVPVTVTDFSGLVATPWKGRNKEEALTSLYLKAGKDVELAECGIVFCDEFDKIIPSRRYSRGGDINDELQGQLLGMFEGTVLDVPVKESGGSEMIQMNTENILFVCAGAFEGLDKLVKKDIDRAGIGFGSEVKDSDEFELNSEVLKTKHLVDYGMKPELAGRLNAVSVLKKLDRDALHRVLTEAEDSILVRYMNEFREDDEVELEFTEDALDVIIDRVMDMNIGARGLNSVIHEMLKTPMFETPSKEGVKGVRITGDAARGISGPEYIF